MKNISNFLFAFLCFCFRKTTWTRDSDPKLIKSIWKFLVTLLHFCFRKTTYNCKFPPFFFLPLEDVLVATFNETLTPTSRVHVAEQIIVMPNWSKTFQNFWFHFSVFALDKQLEILNIQRFSSARRLFGGYFQLNVCTYFEKIWIVTSYSDAILIKDFSILSVRLLRLCFRKTT